MSEIILVDINAHTGSAPVTLRFATQGYVTDAQRTNLLLYSEELNTYWGGACSASLAAEYYGSSPFWTIAKTLSSSSESKSQSIPSPSAGDVRTVTIALLAGSVSTLSIGFYSSANGWGNSADCVYSVLKGPGTLSVQGGTLLSMSGLSTTEPTLVRITRTFTASGGATFYMYPGSSGSITIGHSIKATRAQVEVGWGWHAYMKTTSATVSVPVNAADANVYYEGRVKQPGNIQRNVFDNASTFGRSKVGYGEVVLVNNDGALDAYLGYGFAGFSITITRGVMLPNQTAPVWATVISGTMDSVDFSWNEVSIKVRDRQQELTKPIQASRYGGTNALPNGLDGVATDIKGNGRPILYGRALNFTPPQVNTTRRIYELSDSTIQSVDAVYDRGVTLTAGAAYTSQSDMETNAPAAGQYRVWISSGGSYLRLGSEPSGPLTVDASQGASTTNRTAAQLMQQVMLKGGIASGDITAADVTALDAVAGQECGYWVSHVGSATGTSVLDALANSVGAWWGVDRLGKFRMGLIAAPSSGNSIGTLTSLDIISIDRMRSADQGGGVPAWQVTLRYGRMFTVLNDLGASVPATFKSDRATEWRSTVANDATVKTQWPKAQELQIDTHLLSASAAATEATRRLGMYKVRRDTLSVRVKLSDSLSSSIDLGKTVVVQLPRFGMSAGKAFLVTGIRTDMRNNTFDLTLWG